MHLLTPISRLLLVLLLGVMSLGSSAQYTYFNKSLMIDEDSSSVLITGIEALGNGNYIGAGACCFYDEVFLTFDAEGEIMDTFEVSSLLTGVVLPSGPESLSLTTDGTVVCVTYYDMGDSENLVVRMDPANLEIVNYGVVDYESEYPSSYWSIIETSTGEIILAGSDPINNDEDSFVDEVHLILTKMTNDLSSSVSGYFDFFPGEFCYPKEVFELSDGRLCVFGYLYGGGLKDIWAAVIDSNLEDVSYIHRWEGEQTTNALTVVQKEVDVFQLVTRGTNSEGDSYLKYITFDANTDEELETIDLDFLLAGAAIRDAHITADNGCVIMGYYNGTADEFPEKSWIVKVDSLGNQEWAKVYEHLDPYHDVSDHVLYDLELAEDGGYMCAGLHWEYDGSDFHQKLWLLKLDACGDEEWQGCEPIVGVEEVMVGDVNVQALHTWPNPVSESTLNYSTGAYLSVGSIVELIDLNGKVILSKSTSLPEINGSIEVGQLDAGLYVLRVAGEQKRVLIE